MVIPVDISKLSDETRKILLKEIVDNQVLSKLAKNEEYKVRCCVAANNNTSKEILSILSKDKNF